MLGKKVWNKFGTILRFGTVTTEKTENGWKFVKVDWVDDESFRNSTAWKAKMRGNDDAIPINDLGWYRMDKITEFSPVKTIKTLEKLKL
jgi:hypothetical protein